MILTVFRDGLIEYTNSHDSKTPLFTLQYRIEGRNETTFWFSSCIRFKDQSKKIFMYEYITNGIALIIGVILIYKLVSSKSEYNNKKNNIKY